MIRRCVALFLIVLPLSVLFGQERPDALARYRAGDYEEAIEICLEELQAAPRSRDSYTVLCWSYLALERYEDALKHGGDAYQFAPNDPRIVEVMGEANYFLGRNLEALRYFERYAVIADTGDRIDRVYFYMGEIFIRLAEYNHADIAISTALYHSPNISLWWSRLGYAREMAKDYKHSSTVFHALSRKPMP